MAVLFCALGEKIPQPQAGGEPVGQIASARKKFYRTGCKRKPPSCKGGEEA